MKKFLVIGIAVIICGSSFAQETKSNSGRPIPSVNVKTLNGHIFNTKDFSNNGKPMIIDFWATWCIPCKRELNNIASLYPDWVKKTGVKLIAVSIDNSRNVARVAPYVNSQGWDYDVYLDPNGDFKRAMDVDAIPHTFIVDGNGKIVYQHTSYSEGDEYDLIDEVKKLEQQSQTTTKTQTTSNPSAKSK